MTIGPQFKKNALAILFLALLINAIGFCVFILPKAARAPSAPPAQSMPVAQLAPETQRSQPIPPLSLAQLPSAADTGSCLAWASFARGQQGFEQAKALLLSGPLKNKSWALESLPGDAWEVSARSSPASAEALALADALGKVDLPAPDRTGANLLVWVFEDEPSAQEAGALLKKQGVSVKVAKATQRPLERKLAILPQGPNEIAYARSLIDRLPGSELSAVSCPELAGSLLATAQ